MHRSVPSNVAKHNLSNCRTQELREYCPFAWALHLNSKLQNDVGTASQSIDTAGILIDFRLKKVS